MIYSAFHVISFITNKLYNSVHFVVQKRHNEKSSDGRLNDSVELTNSQCETQTKSCITHDCIIQTNTDENETPVCGVTQCISSHLLLRKIAQIDF